MKPGQEESLCLFFWLVLYLKVEYASLCPLYNCAVDGMEKCSRIKLNSVKGLAGDSVQHLNPV